MRINKLFLSIATLVILTLSYFLIPTVYNKDEIKQQIKNVDTLEHSSVQKNIEIKYKKNLLNLIKV